MKIQVEFSCRSRIHRGDRKIVVAVDEDALIKYQRGEGHVQDLFPELSAAEREMFISGICGSCWNILVPEVDDEEDGQ